jgi:hypothetical protein
MFCQFNLTEVAVKSVSTKFSGIPQVGDKVTAPVAVQPWSSVTVQVYVPIERFWMIGKVCPFDHKKLNGAVPPTGVEVAVPLPFDAGRLPVTLACSMAGWLMLTLAVAVAEPSLTVTVKSPGARFEMLAEVAPFDHANV